ncbi:hypothetical protein JCM11491_002590 [Sporobolomyces phaffii]
MSSSVPVHLEPKHSADDDHALVVPPASAPALDPSPADSTSSSNDGKGSSTLAALSRTLIATLAFLFKRPIRLFRPVKISTWAGIQAIAQEHGLKTVNRQFVRSLIKREGWKFIPRHILPPMVVNAMIGLTLFTSYTTSERLLLHSLAQSPTTSLSPLIEFLYIPFISGSIAGAAQSILSTPLDNARLLLLRRQRYLRQAARGGESLGKRRKGKHRHLGGGGRGGGGGGGLPFVNWYQLLRDSLFQSAKIHRSTGRPSSSALPSPSTKATTPQAALRERRVEQARQWARKGWSLFGLTLVKDSIGFGIFFATFEVGREASRRVGLSIDGISATTSTDLAGVEGRDRRPSEGDGDEKKRRSALGIAVQSFGILLSGGIAGYVFAGLGRPFERMRGAVWEGRARWAETDAKLALAQDAIERREAAQEGSTQDGKVQRRGKSIGGKSERRARKLLGAKGRKIGMVRIGQIRQVAIKQNNLLSARRLQKRRNAAPGLLIKKLRQAASSLAATSPNPRARLPESSTSPPRKALIRPPPPSAPSLILSALARYGPATFLFAPREVLQTLDERLPRLASTSAAQTSFPALTSSFRATTSLADAKEKAKSILKPRSRELDGPTRFIARRRATQELDKMRQASGAGGSSGGRGWRVVSKVFTFVPPYAVGFLVYALVQGDLKAEV